MKLLACILALFRCKSDLATPPSVNLDEAMTALGREIAREIDRQEQSGTGIDAVRLVFDCSGILDMSAGSPTWIFGGAVLPALRG
jgi:hypothetical protein